MTMLIQSVVRSAISAGLSVLMLAAVLGDFAGWHIPFVVLGMAMLLAALIFLYSFPTKNYHRLILIWLGG